MPYSNMEWMSARIVELEKQLADLEVRLAGQKKDNVVYWRMKFEKAEKREAVLKEAFWKLIHEIDQQHNDENIALPLCWDEARAALEED